MRRGDFDGVGRGSNGHDGDTEAKNEAANDKLSELGGASNNNGADNDEDTTDEHALLAAKTIREDSSEGSSNHGTTARLEVLEKLKTKKE